MEDAVDDAAGGHDGAEVEVRQVLEEVRFSVQVQRGADYEARGAVGAHYVAL